MMEIDPTLHIADAARLKIVVDDPAMPEPAKQTARFVFALIEAGRNAQEDRNTLTNVPCMAGPKPRKWCLGLIKLSRDEDELSWECPKCGKAGVIRNF